MHTYVRGSENARHVALRDSVQKPQVLQSELSALPLQLRFAYPVSQEDEVHVKVAHARCRLENQLETVGRSMCARVQEGEFVERIDVT